MYFVYSISLLNTFVSLKRLPGAGIKMKDIPVQVTQQRNHSNVKYYHKNIITKSLYRIIIAKTSKQKLNNQ